MATIKEVLGAVTRSDEAGVAKYLTEGFDPNIKDRDGRTALMHAVIGDKNALVDLLIKKGTDVNIQDQNGYTALHFAAQDFRVGSAKLLLESGAKVDLCDKFGNTSLWRATFNSRERGEIIALLKQHGANPHLKNKTGKSPIDVANTITNYNLKQFFE